MSMSRGTKILAIIVIGVAALGLFGLITQSLWNWLVPALFNGPVITFWQGLGLLVLSKLLFSGFNKGGGGHWRNKRAHWGYYWSDKWKNMSPEDRERFKQKMKDKWCHSEQPTTDPKSDIANG